MRYSNSPCFMFVSDIHVDRWIAHPEFDSTRVRTHDLCGSWVKHAPEMIQTTKPQGTAVVKTMNCPFFCSSLRFRPPCSACCMMSYNPLPRHFSWCRCFLLTLWRHTPRNFCHWWRPVDTACLHTTCCPYCTCSSASRRCVCVVRCELLCPRAKFLACPLGFSCSDFRRPEKVSKEVVLQRFALSLN